MTKVATNDQWFIFDADQQVALPMTKVSRHAALPAPNPMACGAVQASRSIHSHRR
eukprot:CAMPEP_0119310764 /NCGR_PEP_ID=MMETSP1333-20130426/20035_1 /TAXON_ID=418940 /ORGANISM="Scyphosphaera apsteinii, Strain RCC1455" /LENGTH=54 /DNA_ID=CAMNT_0007315007 /DNA_START=28 /DNA_END=189 /DNA_ORIENTATION=+